MDKLFQKGKDRVLFAQPVFGEEEISAVTKALREGWLGPSKYTEEFESKVAAMFGKRYGVFVNSGTSANFLAMEIANLPAGSEVITQACTFPATLSPIVQKGLVPVFVDSKIGSYNIDVDEIERALSEKTKAIFVSHAVGNVNDMRKLREICDRYNLKLIEDSCDTIACRFAGRPTGYFSDIVTTSFYAAHNMTAGGGGGMVMVDDESLIKEARMLTNWGSALPEVNDENLNRLNSKIEEIEFDSKFTYLKQTHNFKGVEMQAAFGLEQLKKLPKFNQIRKNNISRLYDFFNKHKNHFILPEFHPEAEVYLLAFPLTVRNDSTINKNDLVKYLEEKKIQTRPLFSGNILRHPAYKNIKHRVHDSLKNSDTIMANSFLIGCHHGLTDEMIDYVIETFENYFQISKIQAIEKMRKEVNQSFDRVINIMKSSG